MATWYVRPDTTHSGTRNGTSYANAWGGWSEIVWASLAAGDELYVCGSHTIAADISVGAHGAAAGGAGTAKVVIRGDYEPDPGSITPSSAGAELTNNRANTEIRNITLTGNAGPCLFLDSGAARCNYIGVIFNSINPTASSATLSFAAANGKNHSDILIEDCDFNGSCGSSGAVSWFPTVSAAVSTLTRITIRGNRFNSFSSSRSLIHFRVDTAPSATCTMSDIVVDGNQFTNTRGVCIELSSSDKTFARHSGVRVVNNTSTGGDHARGSTILGGFCVVSGFGQSSTALFGPNTISHNIVSGARGVYGGANVFWGQYRIHNNRFSEINTSTIDGNGVLLDHGCQDCYVYENLISRCNGLGGVVNSGCGVMILDSINVQVFANVISDCRTGLFWGAKQHPDTGNFDYQSSDVFCNTILDSVDQAFYLAATADASVNTAKNNAAIGGGVAVRSGVVWAGEDYNAFHNLGASVGHSIGGNSTTDDPLVTDAGVPSPSSLLLDGGADVGYLRDIRGVKGRSYIGAYAPPLSRTQASTRPQASARN